MSKLDKFNGRHVNIARAENRYGFWYHDGFGSSWNTPVLEITLKQWPDRSKKELWRYQMAVRLDADDRIEVIHKMKEYGGDDIDLARFPAAVEKKAVALLEKIVTKSKGADVVPVQRLDVNLIEQIANMVQLAKRGEGGIVRVGSLILCAGRRDRRVNLLAPVTRQFIILWGGSTWKNDALYDSSSLNLEWTGRYQSDTDEKGRKTIMTKWYLNDKRYYLFGRDSKAMLRKLAAMERAILAECKKKGKGRRG